jgi:hypothetical protein
VETCWPALRIGQVRLELGLAEVAPLTLSLGAVSVPAGIDEWLSQRARAARLAGPFDAALDERLEVAAVKREPQELTALVGLGGGLTPSGDDMLVGLIAAWRLVSVAVPAAAEWCLQLAESLRACLHADATPALSRQLLEAAIEGAFTEPVLALGAALSAGDDAALDRAISTVLAMGHRSGADLLLGLGEGLAWAARAGNNTA